MIINKEILSQINYGIIIAVFLLTAIGLLAIYSASHNVQSSALANNFIKQLFWFFASVCTLFITVFIPFRYFNSVAYGMYVLSIFLLICTFFTSRVAEVHRWITIGPIRIQPSEFVKVGVLMALAKYLSNEHRDLTKLKDVIIAFGIILVPFLIVVKQPDLGTALVFISLILPMCYWAGLPGYMVFVLIAPFISLISAVSVYSFYGAMIFIATVLLFLRRGVNFFITNILINIGVGFVFPELWGRLHGYQKHRILTFLGIEVDPYGAGYQVIQSIVAIGSGGFWGKGFMNGTQTQLRFLPAQHTDFIFSVIGEEAGFIGVMIILSLFYTILIRGIYIATNSKTKFGGLVAIGIVAILAFHVIVSISMTVGIMPVTGLPLPFISYGGSSLLANMLMIGLLINASIRRYNY